MNHEIELKYRLNDKRSLKRVRDVVLSKANPEFVHTLIQTNTFFDSSDLRLKANSLTMRLRLENQQAILTLKGNDPDVSSKADYVSVKLEYETHLSAAVAKQMLSHEVSPLEYLSSIRNESTELQRTRKYLCEQIHDALLGAPLEVIGSFSNERTCIPIEIDSVALKLELDETQFSPDITHYEVELEVPAQLSLNKANTYLLKILKKADVKYSTSKGKSDRFYALLRN